MKGYTKIELTNIHTGEKEVVEKHNIVTNNLSEMYKTFLLGNSNRYFDSTDPLYNRGMGGIILFSNQLTEDANKYGMIFNSADDIVGCAGNFVNTSSDKQIGSRNITESKILDNGYKYVWDFGTSQANGTISAVGLTNSIACSKSGLAYATPYPVDYPTNDSSGKYLIVYGLGKYKFSNIVSYNFDNNTFIAVNLVSATEAKFTVYKVDVNTQYVLPANIQAGSKKILKLSETNVTMPDGLNITYGNILDGFDGYYYYVEHPNYNTLKLARISKTNFTYDSTYGLKEITYKSNLSYPMQTDSISTSDKIANGYLYTRAYDKSSALYKIKLSDPAKYTDITIPNDYYDSTYSNYMVSNGKCIYVCGNIIFFFFSIRHYNYYDFNAAVDNPSKRYYFVCASSMGYSDCILISPDSSKFVTIPRTTYYDYIGIGIGYFFNSLSTINNLSSPVVKTADKTMKITYTITEGE